MKKIQSSLLSICALSLTGLLPSHAEQLKQLDSKTVIEMNMTIQKKVDQVVKEAGLPGLSTSYVLSNGYSANFSSGFANIEKQERMTPLSVFLSASNGKTYVGAVIMKLSQDGVLSLDDKISKWFADEEWFDELPNANDITVRHLLSHSSGLKDHVYAPEFGAAISSSDNIDHVFPREGLIKMISNTDPLFPAGQGFAYSDTGFILVGLIIEKATGKSYYDNLNKYIINTFNLYNTTPNNQRAIPGLVQAYSAKENPLNLPDRALGDDGKMTWNPANEFTGGGLASTAGDLASWGLHLFHNDAIQPNYKQMVIANAKAHEEGLYGLGVSAKDTPYGCNFGHNGWIPGYISSFGYYPAMEASVSIMVNSDNGEAIAQNVFMLREEILQIIAATVTSPDKNSASKSASYKKCTAYK